MGFQKKKIVLILKLSQTSMAAKVHFIFIPRYKQHLYIPKREQEHGANINIWHTLVSQFDYYTPNPVFIMKGECTIGYTIA